MISSSQKQILGVSLGKVWRPVFKNLRAGAFGLIGKSARPFPGPSRNLRGLAMSIENLPGEEWLPIVGYESLYSVSNMGRVRSNPRNKWNGKVSYVLPARIMGQQDNGRGYQAVSLCLHDKQYSILYVHRLVANAFLPIPEKGTRLEVNHIDGDKRNNAHTNLEWCTSSENKRHARRLGLCARLGAYEISNSYCVKTEHVSTGETRVFHTLRSASAFIGLSRSGLLNRIRKSESHAYGGFQFTITNNDGVSVL